MAASNSPESYSPQRNTPSPSPRPTASLQAAAAVNAGLQHENSRSSSTLGSSSGSLTRNRQSPHHQGRRRSSVLMNLQLNDPTVPAPGEMITDSNTSGGFRSSSPQPIPGSPRSPFLIGRDPLNRGRPPSLGEIHQEFEAETEAHVNRLLQVIQQQQLQLQQLQSQGRAQGQGDGVATMVPGDESAIVGGDCTPLSAFPTLTPSSSLPRSPAFPRSSFDMARADVLNRRSRTPSRGASPRIRSTSISAESAGGGDQQQQHVSQPPFALGVRDESAFYQAETQMLTRENQMLRHRIRDLEKQLTELGIHHGSGGGASNSHANSNTSNSCSSPALQTHEPFHHSHLTRSTSVSEEDGRPEGGPGRGLTHVMTEPLATVADSAKEE